MKNPPDLFAIALFGPGALICIGVAVFLLLTNDRWGEDALLYSLTAAVTMMAGIVFLTIVVIKQIVYRPLDIKVGDNIVLRYRLKGKVVRPYDSIKTLYLDPTPPRSIKDRWTGGTVRFREDRMPVEVTYEIASLIRQRYLEKIGHYPPQPSWCKG